MASRARHFHAPVKIIFVNLGHHAEHFACGLLGFFVILFPYPVALRVTYMTEIASIAGRTSLAGRPLNIWMFLYCCSASGSVGCWCLKPTAAKRTTNEEALKTSFAFMADSQHLTAHAPAVHTFARKINLSAANGG